MKRQKPKQLVIVITFILVISIFANTLPISKAQIDGEDKNVSREAILSYDYETERDEALTQTA